MNSGLEGWWAVMAYGNKGKNGKSSTFKSNGNKSSGKKPQAKSMFDPRPNQRINKTSQHHDSLNGNRGNGGGKKR